MWGLLLSILDVVGLDPVPYLATFLGTTGPALKLIVSVLMSYPISIAYNQYIQDNKKEWRQYYFILMGLDMAFYNFGITLYHNLIPVIIFLLTTKLLGKGKVNVIVTFVVNTVYLVTGYIVTESEEYDITWTMPHCVLTLKMIALAFDLWDGQKKFAGIEISANNRKTALDECPSIVELLAFVYFPACFLVGPIFSFKRYKSYIEDDFPLYINQKQYEYESLRRFVQGALYLLAFQIGASAFNVQYMQSNEFSSDCSVFYRHVYCGLWAHFTLYKYISCWLLTEASCIRLGFSYNGEDVKFGKAVARFDGCNNIKLMRFETATKFQHYIESFNCNTNYFASEYIYKRLKFLGNRHLSQLCTLLYLALWHGIRSGYYMTFFNEFLIIYMERELETIIVKTEIYNKVWSNPIAKVILYVLLKFYTIVFMGWSLVPFDVKVFSKWWSIYYSLWFSGFILFLPWAFVYKPLLLKHVNGLRLIKKS